MDVSDGEQGDKVNKGGKGDDIVVPGLPPMGNVNVHAELPDDGESSNITAPNLGGSK